MKEILGNNLTLFFNLMDKNCNQAEVAYVDNKYEVWGVSDKLFKKMCDMTEEQFVELAGEDAWWRSSDGSNLWAEDIIEFEVNGKEMVGWDSPIYESKKGHKYENLSEYLCECIGVSQPKNVCACAMDLAKFNGMTMGELFSKYEGYFTLDEEGYANVNEISFKTEKLAELLYELEDHEIEIPDNCDQCRIITSSSIPLSREVVASGHQATEEQNHDEEYEEEL